MRLIAVLTDPEIVAGILRHLDLPDTPPGVAAARGAAGVLSGAPQRRQAKSISTPIRQIGMGSRKGP